jgi:hypothetical protein
MNTSIVVASAPLVANGSFRSANFRNSLLVLGAPSAGMWPPPIPQPDDDDGPTAA